jgi:parallel beta-helix repeat protein
VTLEGCLVLGNRARTGGGLYSSGVVDLDRCALGENWAGWGGGGVYLEGSATTSLFTGCTICRNAAERGGGVFLIGEGTSPILTHCTISGNSASLGGGGIYCWHEATRPTLRGCIVWNNGGGSIHAPDPSTLEVAYSCIEGEDIFQGE